MTKIGVEFINIYKIIYRARILIQNVWCIMKNTDYFKENKRESSFPLFADITVLQIQLFFMSKVLRFFWMAFGNLGTTNICIKLLKPTNIFIELRRLIK